jgi:LacI family transcriptional regulator
LFTDLHLLRAGALRFHGLVFDQARELLTAAGLMTRVYPGSSRDCLNPHQAKYPEFVADVQEGRLRGVIVLAFSMAGEWLEALRARQLPMVHLDYAPHPGCVSLDYAALVRRAVEHLRRRGCRRLALVGYGGGRLGGTAVQDQCAAVFREAVAAAGLPVYDEWIRTDLLPTDTGSGWEEFREVWTAHAEKPDGVLVSDDVLAPDVARAIRELGIRVPDQLTVVTHANRGVPLALPFAAPRLEFDPAAVAAALVRLMVGRLRGELKDDSQITLAPELVDEPETTEAPGLVGARSTP